jgi:hypothetical protein
MLRETSGGRMKRHFLLSMAAVFGIAGCSVHKFAVNKVADAIASSGATFAGDDDPQLVREAVPFGLKLNESLLAESTVCISLANNL